MVDRLRNIRTRTRRLAARYLPGGIGLDRGQLLRAAAYLVYGLAVFGAALAYKLYFR